MRPAMPDAPRSLWARPAPLAALVIGLAAVAVLAYVSVLTNDPGVWLFGILFLAFYAFSAFVAVGLWENRDTGDE